MKREGRFRLLSTVGRSALLLGVLALTACRTDLYNTLEEQQANRMMSVLDHHGIDASKRPVKDGKFALRIARDNFASAMDALDAAGLPQQQHISLKDVFHGGGLVATRTQERAQLMYAIGGELARTVSTIDGILDARVHVVLPESDPLKREIVPSSAAVFVRYAPEIQINPVLPQIKKLVADSVAGLDYERVSVTAVAATRMIDTKDTQREAVVLGIRVNRSSRGLAVSLFSILLIALLVMGGVLARLLLRMRRDAHFHVSFDDKEKAT